MTDKLIDRIQAVQKLRDRYEDERKTYRDADRHWRQFQNDLCNAESALRQAADEYVPPTDSQRGAES